MLNPALVRHDPAATSRLLLTLLAVALLWPGLRLSELDIGVLFDGSNADTMGSFVSAFWPPEHGGDFLALLWQATLETLAIATAGMVAPSLIIILLIARFLKHYQHMSGVRHALGVLRAVSAGMIAAVTWFILVEALGGRGSAVLPLPEMPTMAKPPSSSE